jgi:hypothetical protein
MDIGLDNLTFIEARINLRTAQTRKGKIKILYSILHINPNTLVSFFI